MNKIKEKLLKGCGEELDGTKCCGYKIGLPNLISLLCPKCQAKLQQHEETSKAKNEEFINILDELINEIDETHSKVTLDDIKYGRSKILVEFHGMLCNIKQRIKEK